MTYGDVLPIWWSFTWRAIVAGALAGAVSGFIAGLVFGLGGRPELGGIVAGVLGMLVGIPASIWALRAALLRHGLAK